MTHDLALGLFPVVPSGEVGPRPKVVGKDTLIGIAYARIHLAQVAKLQIAQLKGKKCMDEFRQFRFQYVFQRNRLIKLDRSVYPTGSHDDALYNRLRKLGVIKKVSASRRSYYANLQRTSEVGLLPAPI